jgi:hypothetical protein
VLPGCALALVTVAAGGAVFHLLAGQDEPLVRLLPAFLAGAVLMWLIEVAAMAAAAKLAQGTPPRQVLARMNATSPYRFPATFPGMGWFGLPVARLYLAEGFWPVLLLLGLLLYARSMCLKAWRVIAELREVNRGKEQFVAVASTRSMVPTRGRRPASGSASTWSGSWSASSAAPSRSRPGPAPAAASPSRCRCATPGSVRRRWRLPRAPLPGRLRTQAAEEPEEPCRTRSCWPATARSCRRGWPSTTTSRSSWWTARAAG